MILENQVCSLELAKKIKELGVKQESYFKHFDHKVVDDDFIFNHWKHWISVEVDYHKWKEEESISAFTVAELGEILPAIIYQDSHLSEYHYNNYNTIVKGEKVWEASYRLAKCGRHTDKFEANARAKMLIYLIENKLMESKQS